MSLEIVMGPMFSGKSTYALSYVRRQRAIGKKVLVIKPNIDNRYSNESMLMTHDKEFISCELWNIEKPLYEHISKSYDCFVIEEAQFFLGLEEYCKDLLLHFKKHILVFY